MTPGLKKGTIVSAVVHIAVALLLIFGITLHLPRNHPPLTVELAGIAGPPQVATQADKAGKTPAHQVAPEPTPKPPAKEQPKPDKPHVAPPPPPPPPPPPQPKAEPPKEKPVAPPKPVLSPVPTKVPPPPPPPPLPVPPTPPPVVPPSSTHQENPTKNPAPDTQALDNTLAALRALEKQEKPPKAAYNPASGGAPEIGGAKNGDITATLSAVQRGAIADRVRECWTKDAGALDLDKLSVQLEVTYDAQGVARIAKVGPEDAGRMSDPRFRAFADRAQRAVLNPQCANLPIPSSDLGRVGRLTFRFIPN